MLEQVTGSPFVLGKNTHPLGVAVDPSGKFLYITEFGRSRVAAYRIQRDGALTPVKGSPSTAGQGPK
ncbi:MAG: beta-propeller fold lactonase family protein, partial [Candidatus Cybelea sp.]